MKLALLFFFITLPVLAASSSQSFKVEKTKVDFFALGKPSMLKIHGQSEATSGELIQKDQNLQGTIEILVQSFSTGMSVRDQHLKDKVFEISKFQKANLKLEKLTLPSVESGKVKTSFEGKLNLHGVEKQVSGEAEVELKEHHLSYLAKFDLRLTDFNITPPEFMGMKIQDTVKVEVQGEAK